MELDWEQERERDNADAKQEDKKKTRKIGEDKQNTDGESEVSSCSSTSSPQKKQSRVNESEESPVRGKKMSDEADEGDVEEIRQLIATVRKIETTIEDYISATPEIVERLAQKEQELENAKARHKAEKSSKTSEEVAEIGAALKEIKRSLVEKKVQVSVQGRDLDGLMARLKKVARRQLPVLRNEISEGENALKKLTKGSSERKEIEQKYEKNLEMLMFIQSNLKEEEVYKKSPVTSRKWKVGDKCRVGVKIKDLPDECEAEIEEMLLDANGSYQSSDTNVNVHLHGYGKSLRVNLSQLRPSKGDKARDAQSNAAIAYTISRMEKTSKPKEKQFTEEDFKMSPEDGKVALRNFLEILANMAKEQTARKWQIVRKQIEGLIAGTVSPEAYSARMHKEIITNPQPTLVPFTTKYLPHLQAALKSGELDMDLVHFQKREKTTKNSEPAEAATATASETAEGSLPSAAAGVSPAAPKFTWDVE